MPLIDKVKIKLQDLLVRNSHYSAFWQDQEHLRRMDRMEADATNVTPKILMEEIKDYNWTVDEILAGAPAYDKKNIKSHKDELNFLVSEFWWSTGTLVI